MDPFYSYRLHQIERSASGPEQRLADERAGQMAAAFAGLRLLFTRPAKALLGKARRAPRVVTPATTES
jgi:hypothetical protein